MPVPKGKFKLNWIDWNTTPSPPNVSLIAQGGPDQNEKKQFEFKIESNEKINFTVSENRYCIGSMDLYDNISPCPNNVDLTNSKFDQCFKCKNLDPSQNCAFCKGDCSMKFNYCKLPHVVYLAAYTPEHIKVGVSWSERYTKRIAEQGAIVSAILAKTSNGRDARKLETTIKEELNIPDRVSEKVRFKSFLEADKSAYIENLIRIRTQAKNLIERFNTKLADEEYFDLSGMLRGLDQNKLASMEKITLKDSDNINGTVILIKGFDMILRTDDNYYILPLKKLLGKVILAS